MLIDKIKLIADHYGDKPQLEQTVKELIELADALLHFIDGKGKLEDVIDETADVYVMLAQLVYILSDDDDVDKLVKDRIRYKINRQICRIEQEIEDDESLHSDK